MDETSSPGQESANRLHKQIPEILRRWEIRVRALLPEARRETTPVLIDHLPLFLEELAKALSPTEGQPVDATWKIHGKLRATQTDYSLQQVLQEYHLMRRVVMEV